MRSIERAFKAIQRENPEWSSYVCFSEAIRGRRFSKDRIRRWFDELVDKNDYQEKDKVKLLAYLYLLTKDMR